MMKDEKDRDKWTHAAMEEYASLISNGTWELVVKPEGVNIVDNKWVFKRKYGSTGEIEKWKARLVVRGFSQVRGVDYEETFAPVAKMNSVRAILTVAAMLNWEIHQMDVKTAFLNGNLTEKIYMRQPEGFIQIGREELVCLLKRSLYGLKQASREWNKVITMFLLGEGFKQSLVESCLYIGKLGELTVLVLLYVDDLLAMGDNMQAIVKLKKKLGKRFEMKDMGDVNYFLGLKIERDRKGRTISLSQEQYVKNIVEEAELMNAKAK
jgi:hypothetical protein